MRIDNIEEHGFERAMIGLARSYNQDVKNMPEVAMKLGPKDKGHNKFLESMVVWMEIEAPRFFWSEFDTYRVGMTKQSDSTMHTLRREPIRQRNFEHSIHPDYLLYLNMLIGDKALGIDVVKSALPDGFLQGRSVCTNYKVIRHIIIQRHNHKLPQWRYFCEKMRELKYYNFLGLDF